MSRAPIVLSAVQYFAPHRFSPWPTKKAPSRCAARSEPLRFKNQRPNSSSMSNGCIDTIVAMTRRRRR